MAENAVRIKTDPDPYEPFKLAQAYRVGDLVFVSGQAAIDLDGSIVGAGNFDAQAEQTFKNLAAVLKAGGSSLAKVVKVTIFLKDMSNFGKIVRFAREVLHATLPGRHHRRDHVVGAARARDRNRGDCHGRR